MLDHHFAELHERVDVVGVTLEHIVESVAVGLLKYFEELTDEGLATGV